MEEDHSKQCYRIHMVEMDSCVLSHHILNSAPPSLENLYYPSRAIVQKG